MVDNRVVHQMRTMRGLVIMLTYLVIMLKVLKHGVRMPVRPGFSTHSIVKMALLLFDFK